MSPRREKILRDFITWLPDDTLIAMAAGFMCSIGYAEKYDAGLLEYITLIDAIIDARKLADAP